MDPGWDGMHVGGGDWKRRKQNNLLMLPPLHTASFFWSFTLQLATVGPNSVFPSVDTG